MTWRRFEGSHEEWDSFIESTGVSSPYQTSAWAEFRQVFGWSSLRLCDRNHGVGIQVLIKRFGPLTVCWIPGGTRGELSDTDFSEFPSVVRQSVKGLIYMRISDPQPYDSQNEFMYLRSGWKRPAHRLSSGVTLTRQLPSALEDLRNAYSKNWSRNLTRGLSRNVVPSIWTDPDYVEIAALHREVVRIKGSVLEDWRCSEVHLERISSLFGNKLIMAKAENSNGVLLSIRGAVLLNEVAVDFFAATSAEGRKTYASNVAMDHLLVTLSRRGIGKYDFGGVDRDQNSGVYNFKHGAGGQIHRFMGEFEITQPRLFQPVLSLLVGQQTRRQVLRVKAHRSG